MIRSRAGCGSATSSMRCGERMSEKPTGTNGKHTGALMDQELLACFRSNRQFVMCAHEKPDGDVLGSGFALGLALSAMGKDVVYFLDDEVPKNLQFLPNGSSTSIITSAILASVAGTTCSKPRRPPGSWCSTSSRR